MIHQGSAKGLAYFQFIMLAYESWLMEAGLWKLAYGSWLMEGGFWKLAY